MRNKILLAEDETTLSTIISETLEDEGYEVIAVTNGVDGLEAFRSEHPDMIIADVMMPRMDGLEAMNRIRQFSNVPVILLTAKGEAEDRFAGFELGADDYLVKPFGMMEMVSRVKAVLRRSAPKQDREVLAANDLVLNVAEHTVTAGGKRIALTFKEFELLRMFLSAPGVAFTREKLLDAIWDAEYLGETRTVDIHIRTLRQKLGSYGEMIETVRNVGYRLEVN